MRDPAAAGTRRGPALRRQAKLEAENSRALFPFRL